MTDDAQGAFEAPEPEAPKRPSLEDLHRFLGIHLQITRDAREEPDFEPCTVEDSLDVEVIGDVIGFFLDQVEAMMDLESGALGWVVERFEAILAQGS